VSNSKLICAEVGIKISFASLERNSLVFLKVTGAIVRKRNFIPPRTSCLNPVIVLVGFFRLV